MSVAMSVWRCLSALVLVVGLTACGGSGRGSPAGPHAAVTRAVAAPSAPAVILPASSRGPTTCTVYESHYATQLIFDSQSLNVSAECAAWSSRAPGDGYLWSYQPTSTTLDATAVGVCDLEDPSGRVTARVVEQTGYVPAPAAHVSPAQRARSEGACSSFRAAGWSARGGS
jgi:hypothetical protein